MGDEEAFLRAVAASPEDQAPRLVYADWLDERDDPRGEFIRVRSEIGRYAPHTARYGALRARLKELRGLIPADWAAAMGYQLRHRPLFAVLPKSRQHRWRLVDEFIEVWHRPLGSEDGYPEAELRAAERRLGIPLSAALREWYALAGRRGDVWSNQDRLLPPDEIRIDPGADVLIFRRENQNCEQWGIRVADLGRDDPPVVEVDRGARCSQTTSAFACLMAVYEVQFARNVIWASVEYHRDNEAELRTAAVRGLRPCDLPHRYWALSPIRVFEGTDLMVYLCEEDFVYVAARGEQALQQLDGEVRRRLEVYKS